MIVMLFEIGFSNPFYRPTVREYGRKAIAILKIGATQNHIKSYLVRCDNEPRDKAAIYNQGEAHSPHFVVMEGSTIIGTD